MNPHTPDLPPDADAYHMHFAALRSAVIAGAFRTFLLPLLVLGMGYLTHYLSLVEIDSGIVQPVKNWGIYLGWICLGLGIGVYGPEFRTDLRSLRQLARDMARQEIPRGWFAMPSMRCHTETISNLAYCGLAIACVFLGGEIEGPLGTLLRIMGVGGVVVMGFKMGRDSAN